MTGLEICLVVIGIIMIAISFIFAEHFGGSDAEKELFKDGKFSEVAQELIKKEVNAELSLIVDDKLEVAKNELNKMASEKILALGEYSEDVNLRINKNHEEVMFLYNMLNDKEVVVKNTIKDIEALKVSVKKMAIVNDLSGGDVVKENSVPQEVDVINTQKDKVDDEHNEEVESVDKPVEVKEAKINVKSSNNNKKILELYGKGMSNIEIAKKLGLGVGEVRLVIDLYNSKK